MDFTAATGKPHIVGISSTPVAGVARSIGHGKLACARPPVDGCLSHQPSRFQGTGPAARGIGDHLSSPRGPHCGQLVESAQPAEAGLLPSEDTYGESLSHPFRFGSLPRVSGAELVP